MKIVRRKTRTFIGLMFIILGSGSLYAQTNTFPTSGNAGIGTTSPATRLHLKSEGATSPWISLDKNSSSEESGIQFRKAGSVQFYLYSDNGDDGLRIQSTALTGENDATPRVQIPFDNKNIYFAQSGGNVGIGTSNPSYRLQVHSASSNNLSLRSNGSTSSIPSVDIYDAVHGTEFVLSPSAGKVDLFTYTSHPLALGTGNSERMRIDANGYVGIGTTSPGGKLEINQAGGQLKLTGGTVAGGVWTSAGDQLYLADWNTGTKGLSINMTSGNIGVGATSPLARFHVANGDLLLQNPTSGYPSIYLKDVSGSTVLKLDYNSIIGSGSKFYLRSGSAHAMVLNDTGGNVGIGTASPDEKLTVKGTVHSTRVKVDVTVPGPDYVFEKDYNLLSLSEIKKYIDANKHLPEVPSAKEMEKNGIDVAEMNMLLLKKVEELTLHLIEQQKQIEELKRAVNTMSAESNK